MEYEACIEVTRIMTRRGTRSKTRTRYTDTRTRIQRQGHQGNGHRTWTQRRVSEVGRHGFRVDKVRRKSEKKV